MTDDIDNDGTTLHESGGVVQPTDAQIHNPWRESLENCITGDNYLRSTEWHQLIEELDRLYAIEALAVPQAPLQAEPVPVVASEPVAWLNQKVIQRNGECVGHEAPELSFKRLAYGYDWTKSVPLYATPQAEPAVAEPGGILGTIKSHPNYVAGFKAGHAAGRARAALASQSTPPPESAGRPLTEEQIKNEYANYLAQDERRMTGPSAFRSIVRHIESVRGLAANPTAKPNGGSKA